MPFKLFTKAISLLTLALLLLSPYQYAFGQEADVVAPESAVQEAPVVQESASESNNGKKPEKIQEEADALEKQAADAAALESSSMAAMASSSGDDTFDDRLDYNNGYFTGKVDERTGAFGYSYDFAFIPWRHGLTPQFGLGYNSNGTELRSEAGYGWSATTPYIERMIDTGSNNLYSDNRFYSSLSGELEEVSTGVFKAKYDDGSDVTYILSGNTWTATTKGGDTFTFGATGNSREENPSNSNEVAKYHLETYSNSNGNTVSYLYSGYNNQKYLTQIVYGPFVVEIDYTNTSGHMRYTSRMGGFEVGGKKHIDEVRIKDESGLAVRKYSFNYITADNQIHTLLDSIQLQYHNGSGYTSLPATEFDYANPTGGLWALNGSQWDLPSANGSIRFVDLNGDARDDLVFIEANNSTSYYSTPTGWQLEPGAAWKIDKSLAAAVGADGRFIDLTGDGLSDFFYEELLWINTPNGWQLDASGSWEIDYTAPTNSSNVYSYKNYTDINNDGLLDYYHIDPEVGFYLVYINTGSGWDTTPTGWTYPTLNSPFPGYLNSILVDANGDRLPDVIATHGNGINQPPYYSEIHWNTGSGWTLDASAQAPASLSDPNVRLGYINDDNLLDFVGVKNGNEGVYWNTGNGWDTNVFTSGYAPFAATNVQRRDVNGDSFADFVKIDAQYAPYATMWASYNQTWVNNAHSFAQAWELPFSPGNAVNPDGATYLDLNGDGIPDTFSYTDNKFMISDSERPHVLKSIDLPTGGSTDITYDVAVVPRGAGLSDDRSDNAMATPVAYVVDTVTTNDNNGNTSTTTYSFEDGYYWRGSAFDQKFAGFGKVTATDSLNQTSISYYHQGNGQQGSEPTDPTDGSKIGHVYKTERKNSGGTTVASSDTTWASTSLGNDRYFVYPTQTVSDQDGKISTTTRTYNTSTGNLTSETTTFNDGVSYTDSTTDYTYTSGTLQLPATVTVKNGGSDWAKSRTYYDNQSLGLTNGIGNATKSEIWNGTTWIDSTATYDTYGNVLTETDPENNTTTYVYDAYNIYPATIINDLGHTTTFAYNYGVGQPSSVTDANTFTTTSTYDGLGRVLTVTTPKGLTQSNSYNDSTYPNSATSNAYLDGSNAVQSITYMDGLGRTIQTKTEAEAGNWSTTDTIYDTLGRVSQQSLPYFTGSSAKTNPTTNTNLYASTTYDTLDRPDVISDATGQINNFYSTWSTTVNDKNSVNKTLSYDGHGNLVQVIEHNGAAQYTTSYSYDPIGNLTQLIDAESNRRNFTYNKFGQRLTATDLYASGDATYGTHTYTYDDNGNVLTHTTPNADVITYTYDDLNRLATEINAGDTITYTYDTCTNGIGQACTITTPDITTAYTYDNLGMVATESRTIDATTYVTEHTYDRLGNVLTIEYPDATTVVYARNNAGLLETVVAEGETLVENFDYNALGQVTYKKFGNLTESTYTFDDNSLYRLTNILTEYVGGSGGPTEELTLEQILREGEPTLTEATQPAKSNLKERSNKFELQKGNQNDRTKDIRVEVLKDSPNVRLKKWGGEINLGVSYAKVKGEANYNAKKDLYEWNDGAESVHAYELSPTEDLPQGGFEIEVILNEKPSTNTFAFDIDNAENLDFFYQPALNEEIKLKGKEAKDCTATACGDFERPENVVGSYAVYHKDKTGQTIDGDFQTGKAFHIYRPHIVDANGNDTWGTLDYTGGQLIVTVPQKFLAKATYPVVVDPTFGYDTVGASGSWKRDDIRGAQGIPLTDGTVDSISVHINNGWSSGEEQKAVLFDASGNVIAETEELATGGSGWTTFDFVTPPTVTANTTYLLGVFQDDFIKYSYDSTSGLASPSYNGGSGTYPTTPDPIGTSTSFQFSIYANYTESTGGGGGGPIQDISYIYDNNGNITTITDISDGGLDKVVSYTYDDLNRLTNATTSSAGSDPYNISYTYSATGNILTANGDTYTYAQPGTTNPQAVTQVGSDTYTYDASGNVTSINATNYIWDYRNRLVSIGGTTSGPSTTVYDDNLASGWYDWSWGSTRNFASTNPVYEGSQAVEFNITQAWGGMYLYHGNHDLTGKTDLQLAVHGGITGGQGLYLYLMDDLGNALLPAVQLKDYIPGGTIPANTWSLVTVPLTDLQASGLTIDGIALESSAPTTFSLDAISFIDSSSGGTPTNTFTYDHTTTRIKKDTTIYPNQYYNTDGTTTTLHFYDTQGNLLASKEDTVTSYLHTDHLGGTNVTTDTQGNTVEVVDYYPFGGQRISSTSGTTQQKKFTGHEYDSDTGLTYMKARYYSDSSRRFQSQDPASLYSPESFLQDPQQLNLYTYARNNPLAYTDPTGLAAEYHQDNPGLLKRVNRYVRDNTYSNLQKLSSGSLPVFGEFVDIQELVTGRDYYSGEALGAGGIVLTAVGTLAPFVGARVVRQAGNEVVEQATNQMSRLRRFAKYGREMHEAYKPFGKVDDVSVFKEFSPKGTRLRIDALMVDWEDGIGYINELKPNNSRAIEQGHRQLDRYEEALKNDDKFENIKWEKHVDTYDNSHID